MSHERQVPKIHFILPTIKNYLVQQNISVQSCLRPLLAGKPRLSFGTSWLSVRLCALTDIEGILSSGVVTHVASFFRFLLFAFK